MSAVPGQGGRGRSARLIGGVLLLFVVAVGIGCSRVYEVRPGTFALDPQSASDSQVAELLLGSRLLLGDELQKAAIETAGGDSVAFRLEPVPRDQWPEGPRHMFGSIRLESFRSSPRVLRLGNVTFRDLVVHASTRTGTTGSTRRKPVIARLLVMPDAGEAESLTMTYEPVPTDAERLHQMEPVAGERGDAGQSSDRVSQPGRCDLEEMRRRHRGACCADADCDDGEDCNLGLCEAVSCDVCLSNAGCPPGSRCVENESGCRVCQPVE